MLKPGYVNWFFGLFSGPGCGAEPVEQPLVRVEPVVAHVDIRHAVEIPPARLADRVDGNRALGVLGPVVRLQHLEFAHHVRVRIHGRGAVAARIGGVGAVDDDVERVGAGAVAGEVADRALLAAVAVAVDPDDLAVESGTVARPAGNGRHAGKELEQLRRGPSDHRNVLNLLRREACALFAGIDRGNIGPGRHRHRLGERADLQLDGAEGAALAQAHRDVGRLPGVEALQFDFDAVGSGRHRREDEHAFRVRGRPLNGLRCLVRERDVRSRERAALLVENRAGESSKEALGRREGSRKSQQDAQRQNGAGQQPRRVRGKHGCSFDDCDGRSPGAADSTTSGCRTPSEYLPRSGQTKGM